MSILVNSAHLQYIRDVLGLKSLIQPRAWQTDSSYFEKGSSLADLCFVNLVRDPKSLFYAGPQRGDLTESGEVFEKILVALHRDFSNVLLIEKLFTDNEDVEKVQKRLAPLPCPLVVSFSPHFLAGKIFSVQSLLNKKCLVLPEVPDFKEDLSMKKQVWQALQAVLRDFQ